MIKNLTQAAAIIVISCVLALMINHFRPHGLPLTKSWSVKTRMMAKSGESMIIPLAMAEKIFAQKKAVFVDARPENSYEEAHIKGAISLPWHEVEQKFTAVAENLSPDQLIIAYCDGETCNLSHDLAEFLLNAGFNKVKVLVNGFSVWKNANMPVEGSSVFQKEQD